MTPTPPRVQKRQHERDRERDRDRRSGGKVVAIHAKRGAGDRLLAATAWAMYGAAWLFWALVPEGRDQE